MNRKIVIAALLGVTGLSFCWICQSIVRKKALQKKNEALRPSLRSTPYPYEYSL